MEEDPDDFVRFMPYQVEARFGSKIPCGRSREGEFQKIPSEQHSNTMRLHTTSCGHPGCHRVWRGPWGSFIGGSLFFLQDSQFTAQADTSSLNFHTWFFQFAFAATAAFPTFAALGDGLFDVNPAAIQLMLLIEDGPCGGNIVEGHKSKAPTSHGNRIDDSAELAKIVNESLCCD